LTLLLLRLEVRLQATSYLGGDLPGATDIAVFPFIRQFAAVDPGWFGQQAIPATRAWLARWLGSPLFEACMVKIPSQRVTSYPFFDVQGYRRSLATGIYYMSYYAGGAFGTLAVGLAYEAWGWSGSVATIALVQVLAAGIVLTVWRAPTKGSA
jgi:predicted MFS family arabinose efflux permease